MARTRTRTHTSAPRGPAKPGAAHGTTWRERLFVLAGLGIALIWTTGSLALDAGTAWIGPLWVAAIAWTVLASLAGALRRGLRHRDRSAFGRHDLDQGRDDLIDWSTKTGAYAYLRIAEEHERLMRDDDHLNNHGH